MPTTAKIFIALGVLTTLLLGFFVYTKTNETFGAPLSEVYRSLIPETTQRYNVGTTTAEWNGIFTRNLLVSASSTLQNVTAVNATTTNATSTGAFATADLDVSASLTTANLLATASSTLQDFTGVNATTTQATSTTSHTSGNSTLSSSFYQVGGIESVRHKDTNLIQFASTTVTGTAVVDFLTVGLRDYSAPPIVLLTPVFLPSAINSLACTPSAILATSVVTCQLTSGAGLAASTVIDIVARQINFQLIGKGP